MDEAQDPRMIDHWTLGNIGWMDDLMNIDTFIVQLLSLVVQS